MRTAGPLLTLTGLVDVAGDEWELVEDPVGFGGGGGFGGHVVGAYVGYYNTSRDPCT